MSKVLPFGARRFASLLPRSGVEDVQCEKLGLSLCTSLTYSYLCHGIERVRVLLPLFSDVSDVLMRRGEYVLCLRQMTI